MSKILATKLWDKYALMLQAMQRDASSHDWEEILVLNGGNSAFDLTVNHGRTITTARLQRIVQLRFNMLPPFF